MRFDLSFLARHRGSILTLLICVAIWRLFLTKQLTLYIHPNYEIFAISMASIGLLLAALELLQKPQQKTFSRKEKIGIYALLALVFCGFFAIAPKPLSANSALHRGINQNVLKTDKNALIFSDGDHQQLDVADWANLLAQTSEFDFYKNKTVELNGFIAPSDDPNTFYLSRFLISCCAVDARAIGIPVYSPGWQKQFSANDWILVKGDFAQNPSEESKDKIVVTPKILEKITPPKEPYVY